MGCLADVGTGQGIETKWKSPLSSEVTPMLNNRIDFDADWSQNAVGQIRPMVVRLKARRFLAMVRRDAMVLTTLMVALFSAYFYFGVLPDTRMDLGGIYCYEVQPLAKQLLAGQLDRETARKIERHLRFCISCRKYIEQLRLEAKPTGPDSEREGDWRQARNPQMVAMQGPREQPADESATTLSVR